MARFEAKLRPASELRVDCRLPGYEEVASQHRKRLATKNPLCTMLVERRFRFGDKKEAAGVCRDVVSLWSFNRRLLILNGLELYSAKPVRRALPVHTASVWHNAASAAPAASFLSSTLQCRLCVNYQLCITLPDINRDITDEMPVTHPEFQSFAY